MRVLYILDPCTMGGATKSAVGLITQMQKFGVEPIVCTSTQSDLNDELLKLGICNFAIGHCEMITSLHPGRYRGRLLNFLKFCKYVIKDIKAICRIRKTVDCKEIDLIHTNSSRSDVGFFLSGCYRIPHIVHLREYGDLDYNCHPLNPLYIYYYNAFAKCFLCVSESVKKHWENKGISDKKTTVVYNGVNTLNITISSDNSKLADTLRIVMCGAIIQSKGQHLAVEAVGLLPDSIKKNVEIDFIGWGDAAYKQSIIDYANKVGIKSQVNILGPFNNVLPLLGHYQVGLMCSQSEGFGRVTAEYMHAKLGVVASDSGANRELIENESTGLLFKNGDSQSLADKIQLFYMNRSLLIRCSSEAQKKAMSLYTESLNAKSVYQTYLQIIEK